MDQSINYFLVIALIVIPIGKWPERATAANGDLLEDYDDDFSSLDGTAAAGGANDEEDGQPEDSDSLMVEFLRVRISVCVCVRVCTYQRVILYQVCMSCIMSILSGCMHVIPYHSNTNTHREGSQQRETESSQNWGVMAQQRHARRPPQ